MFKRKTKDGEFIMDPKWAFDPKPPSESTIQKALEGFYGFPKTSTPTIKEGKDNMMK